MLMQLSRGLSARIVIAKLTPPAVRMMRCKRLQQVGGV
jgi:hypothetical protein